jgi:hypothetical protein
VYRADRDRGIVPSLTEAFSMNFKMMAVVAALVLTPAAAFAMDCCKDCACCKDKAAPTEEHKH